MKKVLLGLMSAFLTGCSSSEEKISKETFGGDWPFTINEVAVGCDGINQYVVAPNGTAYALNGSASSKRGEDGKKKYQSLDDIWLEDPSSGPGAHKDIMPIMALAQKYCN